jgi:PIN domain nuclease of toxin-antitoxin system
MRLLLDTAALLWIASGSTKLSPAARAAYEDQANDIYLSVISLWEIIVKNRLGKLPLPSAVPELLEPLRQTRAAQILPLTESAVQTLPEHHRDPFDRMLVCQAIDENLILVTPDATLAGYPVKMLW